MGKLKLKFFTLKTVSDGVDPRDFFVHLDELYKLPYWTISLAHLDKKLIIKYYSEDILKLKIEGEDSVWQSRPQRQKCSSGQV